MCLLIQMNKDTNFSDEFLTGVYTRNSDGIGFMWAENGVLKFFKALPRNAKESVALFREHAQGKDCCVHFRMKTHGHIDLTNCHPYPLLGFDEEVKDASMPILLMHNGVLSTGNTKDLSKSDTWHYIRDYLRPILLEHPDLIHNESFQKIVAGHIGSSNKFAMMDATGKAVILNRASGIEYEGAWLSNTYAWDYYGLHPNAPKYQPSFKSCSGGHWMGNSYWDDEDRYSRVSKPAASVSTVKAVVDATKAQKELPLTRKEKQAIKAELKAGHYEKPLKDVISEYSQMLAEEFPEAADRVTTPDITRLFFKIGRFDAEDFFRLFVMEEITEDEFVTGLKDPLEAQKMVGQSFMDNGKLHVGLA